MNAHGSKEKQQPPERSSVRLEFFRHGVGALTALGGLVGAVATLVAVFSGLFGHGSSNGSPNPPPSTSSVVYHEVVDTTDALTLEVPRSWSVQPRLDAQAGSFGDTFTRPKSTTVGPGLAASSRFAPTSEWAVERAFIGASREAARVLNLPSMSSVRAEATLRAKARFADWTPEGCEFASETGYHARGYIGWLREWRNCGQVGTFYWELYAAPKDRSVMIVVQMQTQRFRGLDVLSHVLHTFRVRADQVPEAS